MKRGLWILLLCLVACGRSGGNTAETDAIDLADRAWCRGDSAQAEALLEELLRAEPRSFQARYRLAIFPIDHAPDVALERLNALAAENPKHPGPVFYAGLARLRLNDFVRAEEDLRQGYALARARAGYSLEDTTAELRQALSDLENGKYAAAAAAFERAVSADPDNATLWYLQARAAASMGDLDAAMQSVETALARRGSFPVARALRGEIFRYKKQLPESRAELERALGDDPDQVQALYQLGLLDLEEAEVRAGAMNFWRAVLADPTFAPPHQTLGQTFMQMEQQRQGMPFYQHFEWVQGFLVRNVRRD